MNMFTSVAHYNSVLTRWITLQERHKLCDTIEKKYKVYLTTAKCLTRSVKISLRGQNTARKYILG